MFRTAKGAVLGMGLMAVGVIGCASGRIAARGATPGQEKDNTMKVKTIEEALKEHTRGLMSVPGVAGTALGLCDGKPCIKVFAVKKTPELQRKIPRILEGYPVIVEETGEIRTLPGEKD